MRTAVRWDGMMPADPADAPTRHPESYPGDIPTHSYLLVGERYARVEPVADRRLPQALVAGLDPALVPEAASGRSLPLSFVLLKLNATQMNRRVAVLSIGSNAAPSQLALKFSSRNVSTVVPVIHARVSKLGISFSAHLNPNGYIPAAPVHAPSVESLENVQVLFLDQEQLNAIDDSEPNYNRVTLSRRDYDLTLGNGEKLDLYSIYRTKHGVLRQALHLTPFADATKIKHQREVLDDLLHDNPRLAELLGASSYEQVERRAATLAGQFKDAIQDMDGSADDGLVCSASLHVPPYGESSSIFEGLHETSTVHRKRVLATPDLVKRDGESVVQLSPESSRQLGNPQRVAIVRHIEKRPYANVAPELRVIGSVQVCDSGVSDGDARLDQLLRDALGVETNEYVDIYPLDTSGRDLSIVGKRRYILTRVQPADITLAEQQGCFLPPSALDILGIVPGDIVFLEGCCPRDEGEQVSYKVSTVRLKAYAASGDLLDERAQLSGGGFDARYPSARDALGIYPDLPWVFIDAGTRQMLGVGRLGAVRIRAGRAYQLSKDLRELMVLLLIAGVGASTQISNPWFVGSLLISLTVLSVLVVLLRLRGRLAAPSTHAELNAVKRLRRTAPKRRL